jgi:hypothetical protein
LRAFEKGDVVLFYTGWTKLSRITGAVQAIINPIAVK